MVGKAMNSRCNLLALLAGAVFLTSVANPAPANMLVSPSLTGRITGLPGGNRVEVDGRMYTIASSSGASEQVKHMHIGDVVDLTLDGAVPGHSSNVVQIHVHLAR
jgi:hypothetical protein